MSQPLVKLPPPPLPPFFRNLGGGGQKRIYLKNFYTKVLFITLCIEKLGGAGAPLGYA
ncbi:hypothetical protein HanIR_Chr13g0636881 [Helianthus annuus]|nr:hypothetical protein HanIR_Chr13g0636881 [Helianthus annuus]